MIVVFMLGFASGLPSELIRTPLQAWFTVTGVSVVSIGLLGLVSLPYAYKFLWAPLLDRYVPPFLGRRTGWLLITQLGLVITIIIMAWCNPKTNPLFLGALALLIAFISASQDISIDAHRTDLLKATERASGTAFYVTGYRLAMLIAGGFALIIAEEYGWRITYIMMAVMMGIGIIATLIAPEPTYQAAAPKSLKEAVIEPWREFFTRDRALAILAFIILYKLSYAFILIMTPTFLLRALKFTLIEVGTVNKGIGLLAVILGVFLGGVISPRLGLLKSLFTFGLLQALGNLIFVILAVVGKNYLLLITAIFIVNFFAGMETAVFVAFLMSLCDHRYTATQYALFSALAMVGNAVVSPIAGYIITDFGWVYFYFLTAAIAIPGLFLLFLLRKTMTKNNDMVIIRTGKMA
jgi:PAT family beta-lactamase induction signal transducer AmpG